jgi:hypothetical protein
MQQRQLRPGDILDDYCPRERRLTNHVVVAMIDEGVKQTRCTTCETEHEYKQGKAPVLRRAKVAVGGAVGTVGAERHAGPARSSRAPVVDHAAPERPAPLGAALSNPAVSNSELSSPDNSELSSPELSEPAPSQRGLPVPALSGPGVSPDDAARAMHVSAEVPTSSNPERDDAAAIRNDDASVHRRLIRATLPRPEGHVPERRATEFTVRQPGSRGRENDGNRGGRHRGARPQGHGYADDVGSRFGGPRQGSGGDPGAFGGRNGHVDGQRGSRPPGQGRGPRPFAGSGRKRGR